MVGLRNSQTRFSERVNFIGQSPAFEAISETISVIARRKCSVVVFGETGTGKEMAARQIHLLSDRADKVFVPVDCTTLTGNLFESQLFGHSKGAFTGAVDNTLGFFRAADGGTIFLDEISEIPLDLQAKLLRVLQENRVTPLGSTKQYDINVRIICATNRDLAEMVKQDKFRSDLYYRLNVVKVEVPPLRQRQEDILLLAEFFLNNQAYFYGEKPKVLAENTKQILLNYNFPGNVRELANAMERAYVLSLGDKVLPAVLPTEMLFYEAAGDRDVKIPTLDQANRKLVIQALDYTNGKKLSAAKILGIERRKFNRMLEKFKISAENLTEN